VSNTSASTAAASDIEGDVRATDKSAASANAASSPKTAGRARRSPAKRAAPRSAPTKKAAATKAAAPSPAAKKAAEALRVRDDESPWTPEELAEVRQEIEMEVERLKAEISLAESDLVDLMRDAGDGAGDDQADAGAKTFEREQEIAVADNARHLLLQNLHALERLDDGTYGICESCGNPIGKLRLQAAPRATLCLTCKTKQERR
jgi:RNA polymerase-binding transcription factor